MTRVPRNIRKIIDLVASNNEDAALAVMRAAELTGDKILQQKLFGVIHQLNQDAEDLRLVRENLVIEERRRA